MSGDSLRVRELRENDLSALVEIDSIASGTSRADYLQDKTRRALEAEHPPLLALVAEEGGEVVGFLMGQLTKGEFGISTAMAVVDTVGIHPDYQGKGVGRRLMGEFLLRAKMAGASQVRTIVDWSQWDLMAFFRTMGFEPGTGVVLQRSF